MYVFGYYETKYTWVKRAKLNL